MLDELTVPALLLWGENDLLTPAKAARRVTVTADRAVAVIPSCGHCPQLDCPSEFLAEVLPLSGPVTDPSGRYSRRHARPASSDVRSTRGPLRAHPRCSRDASLDDGHARGPTASSHHGPGHDGHPAPDPSGAPDDTDHAPDHGAFHLCLAVLVAATLTLAICLLLRTAGPGASACPEQRDLQPRRPRATVRPHHVGVPVVALHPAGVTGPLRRGFSAVPAAVRTPITEYVRKVRMNSKAHARRRRIRSSGRRTRRRMHQRQITNRRQRDHHSATTIASVSASAPPNRAARTTTRTWSTSR